MTMQLFGGALCHAGLTAAVLAGPLVLEHADVFAWSNGNCRICDDFEGFIGDPSGGWDLSSASDGPTYAWSSAIPPVGSSGTWSFVFDTLDSYQQGPETSYSMAAARDLSFTVTEPYWLTATWSINNDAFIDLRLFEEDTKVLDQGTGTGSASFELVPGKQYKIVVANMAFFGAAELEITFSSSPPCHADLNGDGTLDFFDVEAFLAAFAAGDPSVDFNGDGSVDFFDVQTFLIEYQAGCP